MTSRPTSRSRASRVSRSAVAVLLAAVACGDSTKTAARADSALPIVAAADTGWKDNCPVTGLWAQCTLLYRLERGGLTVRADSMTEAREPRLSIAGRRLPIARGEIAFFVYADTGSRSRDQARLDTAAFIPPSRLTGIDSRTLIGNQNLLVIMKVPNETYRERLANAIMAGPPQPAKRDH
jgi:hypothetical protein